MPATKEILNEVFRNVFGDASITICEDMTASDIKGWDSLNHITLIYAVEKKFKVSFTLQEVTALKKVGDLISLIDRKSANAL